MASRSVTDRLLQAISTDGVCWAPGWALPFESGLSRLWKLVFTNALTPPQLGRLVGRSILHSDTHIGLHGRSFLAPFRGPTKSGKPSYFAELLGESLLADLPQSLRRSIASDIHIRYCSVCLGQGYHSEFFQLDGLTRCPVHDEPLLNHCRQCRQRTGRYAMTRTSIMSPFRCGDCGKPLGDTAPASPIDFTMAFDTGPLEPIAQFLDGLQMIQLEWPTHEQWQYRQRWVEGDGSKQRIDTLAVLRTFVPIALPERFFENPTIHIIQNEAIAADEQVSPNTVEYERYAIYVRYRDFLSDTLTMQHEDINAQTRQALEYKSELIYPDMPVCPLWFAFYLWKFHFEQPYAGSRKLRPAVSAWPLEANVNNALWSAFCEWAFFAYVDVANVWCEKVELDRQGHITCESILTAMEALRIELIPDWRAWPTAISFLRLTHPDSRGCLNVLLSASSSVSLESLLESHHHGNCPH